MTLPKVYEIGDVSTISGAFTDGGVASDPAVVKAKVKNPAGTITTYTYNTDPSVIRDSAGNYHMDVLINAAGVWHYRWEGFTADLVPLERGGGEGHFKVSNSEFTV